MVQCAASRSASKAAQQTAVARLDNAIHAVHTPLKRSKSVCAVLEAIVRLHNGNLLGSACWPGGCPLHHSASCRAPCRPQAGRQ